MTKIFGVIALAGLATGANAALVGLNAMVSLDGGATWSESVNANVGQTVTVGIFAEHDASVYGFGTGVCRIRGNTLAGDAVALVGAGRVSPFNFGNSPAGIFTNFADANTGFRIDAASDAGDSAAGGVSITQRDPSSAGGNYVSAPSALGFLFTVTVGNPFGRSINIVLDQVRQGSMAYHSSSSATRGTNTTDWSVDGAVINVVPTPASLALVGLGGLVAGRRRR